MAVAIRQQVDPSYLLQRSQWGPQGWSVLRSTVVRQLPVYTNGTPAIATTVDSFEWVDAQLFGVGNADDGMSRLRTEIQRRGSDVFAYALLRRDVVNVLGFHVWSYRLVILHSLVQLLEWAVAILAIAFAAVLFIQYVTTGRAPALTDLGNFFSGLIKSAGDAGGTITSGLSQPFLVFMLAGGVAAILFAQAQKGAGVSAGRLKQPSGSIGLKTGPLSTRVGS